MVDVDKQKPNIIYSINCEAGCLRTGNSSEDDPRIVSCHKSHPWEPTPFVPLQSNPRFDRRNLCWTALGNLPCLSLGNKEGRMDADIDAVLLLP